jgi:hypothetical protein
MEIFENVFSYFLKNGLITFSILAWNFLGMVLMELPFEGTNKL